MENRNIRKSKREIRKEKIEDLRDLNLVSRIFMRLYYAFEELIWLMVSVGIFVLFLKVFALLPF